MSLPDARVCRCGRMMAGSTMPASSPPMRGSTLPCCRSKGEPGDTPPPGIATIFTQGTFVGRGVMSPGYRVLIIRAHLRPGDSGAPVTDRSGSLIGMVIGRLADHADLGVIITASEINGFLSRGGIGPLARQAASFRSEDPDGLVARMSALVQCKPVARSRNPPRPPGSRLAPAREGTGAASGGRRTAALIRPRR